MLVWLEVSLQIKGVQRPQVDLLIAALLLLHNLS